MKRYAFANSGSRYSCPVDGEDEPDLFVNADAGNINAVPEMIEG